jgi:hypothetical protein
VTKRMRFETGDDACDANADVCESIPRLRLSTSSTDIEPELRPVAVAQTACSVSSVLASAESSDVISIVGESARTMSTSPRTATAVAASSGVDVRRGPMRGVAASAGAFPVGVRPASALSRCTCATVLGGIVDADFQCVKLLRTYVVSGVAFNRREIRTKCCHNTHQKVSETKSCTSALTRTRHAAENLVFLHRVQKKSSFSWCVAETHVPAAIFQPEVLRHITSNPSVYDLVSNRRFGLRPHFCHFVQVYKDVAALSVVLSFPPAAVSDLLATLAYLETRVAGVQQFSLSQCTLEDLFVKLTHGQDQVLANKVDAGPFTLTYARASDEQVLGAVELQRKDTLSILRARLQLQPQLRGEKFAFLDKNGTTVPQSIEHDRHCVEFLPCISVQLGFDAGDQLQRAHDEEVADLKAEIARLQAIVAKLTKQEELNHDDDDDIDDKQ